MSAIWGRISQKNLITENEIALMQSHYEEEYNLDNIRTYSTDSIYMACGIQYITKEATREILPINDTAICFNADCILDNRQELMVLLNLTEENIPDGTLMYKAYLKWGIDCVRFFRGLFAIAVFDYKEKCLYLASDPVSSRCLYYHITDDMVTFSTLINPILKVEPHVEFNELYIKDFLVAPGMMPNLVPEETPYKNIYKMNPGTYIKISAQKREQIQYWNIADSTESYTCKTAKEYGDHFLSLYADCVKDATRTCGEVGISMSSGLDSASVGVLAAKTLQAQNKNLLAYTYVPYEAPEQDRNKNNIHNETADVQQIAKMYPNIIPHFLSNEGKNAYDEIDRTLSIIEIPVKAFVNFPNLFEVYQNGSESGCKVMLSGQTGNISVSHGYIDDVLFDLYRNKHYLTFLLYLNRYSKTVKESRKMALKQCHGYFKYSEKVLAEESFEYKMDNPFVCEDILTEYPLYKRLRAAGIDYTKRIPTPKESYDKYIYRQRSLTYIGEFETKIGLKYNIILRDPTKDVRILRFCYHMPYKYFAYKGTPRWLIRGNFSGLLPDSILNNWMRYGVQNSDWFNRIKRDWESLKPTIQNDIFHHNVSLYVNRETVHKYFSNMDNLSENKAGDLLSYMIYICIVSRFLR